MGSLRQIEPGCTLTSPGLQAAPESIGTTNWAGYQDTGGTSKNLYSSASIVIKVPTAAPTDSTPRVVSAWVGLDGQGGVSPELIQTGIITGSMGYMTESVGAWIEIYPGVPGPGSSIMVSSPSITAGDQLYAYVKYQSPYPLFELFDETTGVATAYQLDNASQCPYNEGNTNAVHVCNSEMPSGGYTSGFDADAIVEENDPMQSLAWFGTIPFISAADVKGGTSYNFPQLSNNEYVMYRPSDNALWAEPGAFNTAGTGCTTTDEFCVYRSANS